MRWRCSARPRGNVLAIVSLIAANMVLFTILAGFALLRGIRAPTGQTRSLALALAMVSGAFSLGAAQRLGLQMYRTGLIDGEISKSILFEFQLLKSWLSRLNT